MELKDLMSPVDKTELTTPARKKTPYAQIPYHWGLKASECKRTAVVFKLSMYLWRWRSYYLKKRGIGNVPLVLEKTSRDLQISPRCLQLALKELERASLIQRERIGLKTTLISFHGISGPKPNKSAP
jgi:hypothetical protein